MADENNKERKTPKLPFGIPAPPPAGASPEETKRWLDSLDEQGPQKLKQWIESLRDDDLAQLLP
jgi:hypothetical protein